MNNFLGLMWFDNDPKKDFSLKVAEAARRYYEKFGRLPTICLVNPGCAAGETHVQSIVIKPSKSVMPHHFWIGAGE